MKYYQVGNINNKRKCPKSLKNCHSEHGEGQVSERTVLKNKLILRKIFHKNGFVFYNTKSLP